MLIEKMQESGLGVELAGDKLKVTGTLNDEQRQFIRDHKQQLLDELELKRDPLATMRKSQPPGWGWWGYLLADGGRGSIRGPYPDREPALVALQAELPGKKVIKIVPFPGTVPEPDMPVPSLERIEVGRCKPPVVTCEICQHWTPDSANPPGGHGSCGRGVPGYHLPWSKCGGEK